MKAKHATEEDLCPKPSVDQPIDNANTYVTNLKQDVTVVAPVIVFCRNVVHDLKWIVAQSCLFVYDCAQPQRLSKDRPVRCKPTVIQQLSGQHPFSSPVDDTVLVDTA